MSVLADIGVGTRIYTIQ